jgi:hypothetical protein
MQSTNIPARLGILLVIVSIGIVVAIAKWDARR